ncbi:MAG: ArsR family transcriptional regulator [Desulfobacteraceae bacterium]|nr:MAG: ArsR family transcriptional regulator [Desulfobacteraceae bacterium]
MKIEPSEIFKVLSVETRVKILELLKAHGPSGAKDIAATIGVTTAAVSQHLKILKQAGLVRSERKGYWIPYSIDEKAMENCRQILNEVCTCGCQGTGKFREVELERSNLESLKKYEEELKNELNTVGKRVKELESTKK